MCKVAQVDASKFPTRDVAERLVGTRDFESADPYVQWIAFKPFLQDQINKRYTEREIYDLYDMLNSRQAGLRLWEHNLYYCSGLINRCDLSNEAFLLIAKPLEDMPLYINDDDREVSTVAIWRLKWAK